MDIQAKQVYNDNRFDRLFIALFSRKMAKAVGKSPRRSGYDGFVDLSKQIMAGRNAQDQQQLVAVARARAVGGTNAVFTHALGV
jgi:hypothetical protein